MIGWRRRQRQARRPSHTALSGLLFSWQERRHDGRSPWDSTRRRRLRHASQTGDADKSHDMITWTPTSSRGQDSRCPVQVKMTTPRAMTCGPPCRSRGYGDRRAVEAAAPVWIRADRPGRTGHGATRSVTDARGRSAPVPYAGHAPTDRGTSVPVPTLRVDRVPPIGSNQVDPGGSLWVSFPSLACRSWPCIATRR
jgi:hypothetical protein